MGEAFVSVTPLLLIFLVFYFLLLRPQQQRLQKHREMVDSLRRGDSVVTAGGIVAKIIRVRDADEVEAEISEKVRVRLVRSTIAEVRSKGGPVRDSGGASRVSGSKDEGADSRPE